MIGKFEDCGSLAPSNPLGRSICSISLKRNRAADLGTRSVLQYSLVNQESIARSPTPNVRY
jgi:hypothetical protein